MTPLKLLVLANKDWGLAPNQRYRIEAWAPYLERDHGIAVELVPFESAATSAILYAPGRTVEKSWRVGRDFLRRFSVIAKARTADAVMIVREEALVGPPLVARAIARTATPILFDYDDAIWLSDRPRSALFDRLRGRGKFAELCRLAAVLTPGNAMLAEEGRRWNENVEIVPSTIELSAYPLLPESRSGRFTICWTGSHSTLAHLETVRVPIEALAARRPVTVRVICDRPPDRPFAGAETDFVRWSAASEAADVADCHVGIMPLPDTPFTRGKCAMKALQYMAVGRPAIVSPVGVNRDVVRDGRNGLIASTDDEWERALETLATTPSLRATLGAEARRTVEEGYSAERIAARVAALVRGVVRTG